MSVGPVKKKSPVARTTGTSTGSKGRENKGKAGQVGSPRPSGGTRQTQGVRGASPGGKVGKTGENGVDRQELSKASQQVTSKAEQERADGLSANLAGAYSGNQPASGPQAAAGSSQGLDQNQLEALQQATGWSPEQVAQLQGQEGQSPYFAGQTDDGRGFYVSQGESNGESGEDGEYTLHTLGEDNQVQSSPLEFDAATRSTDLFINKEKSVLISDEAGEPNPTFTDVVTNPDTGQKELKDHKTKTHWFD
jgi:hypothetical protein